MEDGLGEPRMTWMLLGGRVLILVLVEDGLGVYTPAVAGVATCIVLILVLVEDGLGAAPLSPQLTRSRRS